MKRLRRLMVCLGLVILVAAILLWLSIDHRATEAMTESIATAGKVPCRIERMHVSLPRGRLTIGGLVIGNPEKFPKADMLSFEEAVFVFDVRTLRSEPVHVVSVEILRPMVRLERSLGGSNVKTFGANIRKYHEKKRAAGRKVHIVGSVRKRMYIDSLTIIDGTVEIGSGFSKSAAPIKLAAIKLHNLRGRDAWGITIGQLAGKIIELMASRAAIQAGLDLSTLFPAEVVKSLKKAVEAGKLNKPSDAK